ncbi:MAG TPA: nitrilase-related carbon-nitrogen hydrolase [Planctomycetota bacterium]|nr:nitrilase-related carbon-nitrogen hydrolase [Planctomycetota bacterium]
MVSTVTGTEQIPEEFLAACVQFDVRPGDVAANLAAMRAGVDEAVAAGSRLCVLPELWSTSFLQKLEPTVLHEAKGAEEDVRELSATHGLVIVGSTVEAEGEQIFNTARVYENGNLLDSYRKIHLFSPNLEHRFHCSGTEPRIVQTKLGRLGVLISYDLRFPELSRYYFHKGAEMLVVPAQWPEARAQHWRTLLRARAIENEIFVLGCNRTGQEPNQKSGEPMAFPGDARIVDPTGEVLAAGSGDAGAVVAPIELRKVRTMRRILPIEQDLRPSVYRHMFEEAWPLIVQRSREANDTTAQAPPGPRQDEGA